MTQKRRNVIIQGVVPTSQQITPQGPNTVVAQTCTDYSLSFFALAFTGNVDSSTAAISQACLTH